MTGTLLPALLIAIGILVMGIEAIVPGAFIFVPGTALLLTGLTGLLSPTPVPLIAYLAIFTIASAIVYLVTTRYLEYTSDKKKETSDANTLAGAEGIVKNEVTHDTGAVRLVSDARTTGRFSATPVEGVTKIEEGERVRVVEPNGGSVLTVEPIENADD